MRSPEDPRLQTVCWRAGWIIICVCVQKVARSHIFENEVCVQHKLVTVIKFVLCCVGNKSNFLIFFSQTKPPHILHIFSTYCVVLFEIRTFFVTGICAIWVTFFSASYLLSFLYHCFTFYCTNLLYYLSEIFHQPVAINSLLHIFEHEEILLMLMFMAMAKLYWRCKGENSKIEIWRTISR